MLNGHKIEINVLHTATEKLCTECPELTPSGAALPNTTLSATVTIVKTNAGPDGGVATVN